MADRTRRTNDPAHQPAALDTIQAAAYLSVERSTLKKWRTLGTGPTYARLGSKIVYLVDDLDEFLHAHRVSA